VKSKKQVSVVMEHRTSEDEVLRRFLRLPGPPVVSRTVQVESEKPSGRELTPQREYLEMLEGLS